MNAVRTFCTSIQRLLLVFVLFTPTLASAARATPGSTTPSGALFLNKNTNTYSASAQVDTVGGMHAAYVSDPENKAYYSYCAPTADCANAANWHQAALGNNAHEVQLALTPQGQPRMLLLIDDYNNSSSDLHDTYWYAQCDSSCADTRNWSLIFITGTVNIDPFIFDTTNHYFALDPQGRPRFLFTNTLVEDFMAVPVMMVARCDTTCTATNGVDGAGMPIPANWSYDRINGSFHQMALTFTATGQPRIGAFTEAGDLTGQDIVQYVACDSGCNDPSGWTITPLNLKGVGSESLSLRMDSQDRPRMALYWETGQMTYVWCNSNCSTAGSWGSAPVGLGTGNGKDRDGDLQLDKQDRPRIAFFSAESPANGGLGVGLGYETCETNCESTGAQWQRGLAEDSSVLNRDWPLPRPANCLYASWLGGYRPALALDAAGNPRVAYDADFVAGGCPGVERTHSGVRFIFFTASGQPGQRLRKYIPLVRHRS